MADDILELEVALLDVEPRVWRVVAVPATMTLADFHRVLQVTMGWTDSHLHEFVTESGQRYEAVDPDVDPDGPEDDVGDASEVVLGDVLRARGASLKYEYDFGDGWEHRIKVLRTRAATMGERYPRCIAGERACPPEDCGGPWGYAELLEALADPGHERHDELREWVGPYFDPEAFDIDEVNRLLLTLG